LQKKQIQYKNFVILLKK